MIDTIKTDPIPQHILRSDASLFTYRDITEQEVIAHGGVCVLVKSVLSTKSGGVVTAIKRPRENQDVCDIRKRLIQREAMITNYVGVHNNNISVIDWGRNKKMWIAMEYADGGTLADRVDDMSFIQSLWIAIHITKGIQYAHKNNIYHFDIKPENIVFVRNDNGWDTPKIIDWGVARSPIDTFPHVKEKDRQKVHPTHRKKSGEIIELPHPMEHQAPECIIPSETRDNRTDIYSLSSVLYRLFTGKHKFRPVTLLESEEKIFKESHVIDESKDPKRPSSISNIPESIDNILMKGLKTRKEDRYEHIHQLKQDLVRVYNEEADSHHPNVY